MRNLFQRPSFPSTAAADKRHGSNAGKICLDLIHSIADHLCCSIKPSLLSTKLWFTGPNGWKKNFQWRKQETTGSEVEGLSNKKKKKKKE
jgi:hypothetical protein